MFDNEALISGLMKSAAGLSDNHKFRLANLNWAGLDESEGEEQFGFVG